MMVEMSIDSIRVSLMNYQRVVILKEILTEEEAQRHPARYLPIWIGPAEADAIAVKLQDISVPRPLTHDLTRNLMHHTGMRLLHIVISDLSNDTFYAILVLRKDGGEFSVDCRPSDAMALATRPWTVKVDASGNLSCGCPTYTNKLRANNTCEHMDELFSQPGWQQRVEDAAAAARASGSPQVVWRENIAILADEKVLDKAGILLDKETGKPVVPPSKEGGAKLDDEELRRLSAFKEFVQSLDFSDMEKDKEKKKEE